MSKAKHIKQDQLAINTATVELKVITVSNKKMTLSVFRQLPEVNPWTDSAPQQLREGIEIWGYVSYEHKNYAADGHHVLFVEGGELRRHYVAPVYLDDDWQSNYNPHGRTAPGIGWPGYSSGATNRESAKLGRLGIMKKKWCQSGYHVNRGYAQAQRNEARLSRAEKAVRARLEGDQKELDVMFRKDVQAGLDILTGGEQIFIAV